MNNALAYLWLFMSVVLTLGGLGFAATAIYMHATTDAVMLNDYWQTSVCLMVLSDWSMKFAVSHNPQGTER